MDAQDKKLITIDEAIECMYTYNQNIHLKM